MGAEEPVMPTPLADTLVALVESLRPPEGSGLTLTAARLDVPLEGWMVSMGGAPLFVATVPHSRWRSGFLPPVQVARLDVAEMPEAEDDR
jgi:hypothetical protein